MPLLDMFAAMARRPLLTGIGITAAIATTHIHPFRGFERGASNVATGDPNALPEYMKSAERLSAYEGLSGAIPGLELNSFQSDVGALAHSNLRASYYSGPVPNVNAAITDIPTPQSLGLSSGALQSPNMGNLVLGLYNNRLK